MDSLSVYQSAILSLLKAYAAIKPANMPEVEQEILADLERNHFALIRIGWAEGKFVYHSIMHFDIKDGKIWLQRNWTDRDLAEELVEKGVKRSDIVIGFIPPIARGHSGYAA